MTTAPPPRIAPGRPPCYAPLASKPKVMWTLYDYLQYFAPHLLLDVEQLRDRLAKWAVWLSETERRVTGAEPTYRADGQRLFGIMHLHWSRAEAGWTDMRADNALHRPDHCGGASDAGTLADVINVLELRLPELPKELQVDAIAAIEAADRRLLEMGKNRAEMLAI